MRKTFKIGGVVLLAVLLLVAVFGLRGDDLIKETQEDASRGFYRENLARLPGVKVTADSVENENSAPLLRWMGTGEIGQAGGPAPTKRDSRSIG